MLAACTGRDVPPRASNGFVERTFDSFAASFEAKLERLSYRAPALVAAMLEDSASSRRSSLECSMPAAARGYAARCWPPMRAG